MEHSKLEYYLSKPRLNRFIKAANGSPAKAQLLYKDNLLVSQAFYPVLNLFEIFLRNKLNNQLAEHFSNPNWIVEEKLGFMNDPSLEKSKFILKKSVLKAENLIFRKGNKVTSGKVLAEQSFGFWTSLFEPHHFKLICGVPILCFPNKPNQVNRKLLARKLNTIREFRNRIYHNEPICFIGDKIDYAPALKVRFQIIKLLEWMEKDLVEFINQFDFTETIISKTNHY